MKNKFFMGSIVGGAVMLILLVIAGIASGNASATNMKCPQKKICYVAVHQNGNIACKHQVNDAWTWLLPLRRCGQEEPVATNTPSSPTQTQVPSDPTGEPGINPLPTVGKPTVNPIDPPKATQTPTPTVTPTATPTIPIPMLYSLYKSSDVCMSTCDAQGTQLAAISTIAAAQATIAAKP